MVIKDKGKIEKQINRLGKVLIKPSVQRAGEVAGNAVQKISTMNVKASKVILSDGDVGGDDAPKPNVDDEKQTGLLGSIITKLGPLAVLLQIKPVVDLIKILLGFITITILKIAKFLGISFGEKTEVREPLEDIKAGAEKIKSVLEKGVDFVKKVFGKEDEEPAKFNDAIERINATIGNLIAKKPDITKQLDAAIGELTKKPKEFDFAEESKKIVDASAKIETKISDLQGFLGPEFIALADSGILSGQGIEDSVSKEGASSRSSFSSSMESLKTKIGDVVTTIKTKFGEIITAIKNIADRITVAVEKAIGKVQSVFSRGRDVFNDVVEKGLDKVKNFFSGGSEEVSVDDAIIQPNGRIIRTNPRDTLIATKNPGELFNPSNKNGGTTVNFIFNGLSNEQMMEKIRREFGTRQTMTSRF